MEEKSTDAERVLLNVEEDLLFVTVAQYRAFLAQGNMDAYVLFGHLCFTGKLQGTNSVWANRAYLKKGLRWGQERIDAAMTVLLKMELVSVFTREREGGKIGKTYFQIHRTLTPSTNDLGQVKGDSTNDLSPSKVSGSTKCLNEKLVLGLERPEKGVENALASSATSRPEPAPTSELPPSPSLRSGNPEKKEAGEEESSELLDSMIEIAREMGRPTGFLRARVKSMADPNWRKNGPAAGPKISFAESVGELEAEGRAYSIDGPFAFMLERFPPEKWPHFVEDFDQICEAKNAAALVAHEKIKAGERRRSSPDYCPECHVKGGHGVFCSRPDLLKSRTA